VKFTLSWLREHLDTQATLGAITDTLTRIGLEVEAVHDPAAALAPFVTALVIEAVQHPNADRLRVCRVSLGAGPAIQVVCGAPNARTGMAAVFAPPGALIPATGITLKTGEIRGVQSAGMLVSQRELGLGEDHDGIIELPEGTEPGQAYAAFAGLDDPLVEIGVTPNRGDALGVRGIARDLAAAGLGRLRPWPAGPALAPSRVFCPIAWRIEAPEACSWVLGRQIARVRNPASPDWLARRLTAVGLRPISALVDVTNFFVHDLGRPLHVFDADRIAGGTLTVRRGRAGETFFGLDDRNYDVTDQDIVIADASGVISLAGIMGGKSTAVSERTRNVFVECALFDPVMIALSGRRHQIRTDARARFERGDADDRFAMRRRTQRDQPGRRGTRLAAECDDAVRPFKRACGHAYCGGRGGGHAEPVGFRDAFPRPRSCGGGGAVLAQRCGRQHQAGPDRDGRSPACAAGRGGGRFDRTRGGFDRGSAAYPRAGHDPATIPAGDVAGAGGDADAAADAHGAGSAAAGVSGDGGVRGVQLHEAGGRGAVRWRRRRAAGGEPDRGRSGPDAADAAGDAGACRAPECGAGAAGFGVV
jgi:tRNA-binding EMAP/Myf-like protein